MVRSDSAHDVMTEAMVDQAAQALCARVEVEANDGPNQPFLEQELVRLRRLWQSSPELFSEGTLQRLRELGARSARPRRPGVPDGILAAERILSSVFGYHAFRPGQRELVDAVLSGRDALGIMPTGSGKSLAYQIPAHVLPGTVLVTSPLIALMKDQVDALEQLGTSACFLNSSLGPAERDERLRRARAGEYRLIYVAPEGLKASLGRQLGGLRVSLIAVDEAHCISQWGHDFRPAYRQLSRLRRSFPDVPVLGLTATASPEVAKDIIEQLNLRDPFVYLGSFFRSNLHVQVRTKGASSSDRRGKKSVRDSIRRLVLERDGQSGIVYCLSRRSTESLAEFLRGGGCRAQAYHAGMTPEQRNRVQDAFRSDEIDVVVATIAFGMGIDKSNVRYVIHRDLPRSIEGYYQEIGRAGRDGLPSDCILFYSWADVVAYDRLLDDTSEQIGERSRQQIRQMYRFAEGKGCRHQWLVRHFGESLPPCRTSCDQCNPSLSDLGFPQPVRSRRDARGRSSGDEPEDILGRLKALRKELAKERGIPAYVIFSDATLAEMASVRPQTEAEMLEISGVGPKRLARYGRPFLAVFRE